MAFPATDLPRHVEVLLHETSEALEVWEGSREEHEFVPADYVLVYDALCELRKHMPQQPRFMEWGSGLGLVAMLASSLGWQAEGVEILPELVEESRYYAGIFDLPIRVHQGSFFKEDANVIEHLEELCGKSDLFYVYPWPDQEIEIFDLFDRLARPGALLLTYFGLEDLRVFRKEA
ncbi:hypothetical protein P3T73_13610 [Kiritimatiellota bacterium B12222]|nr:hypothetical protein P3T73_13610 [Kiritimatiellota bacterium B12222]